MATNISYARWLTGAGIHAAARLPLIRAPLKFAYGRYFNRIRGRVRLFSGIYPDFPSALRAIPPDRLVGYDNVPSARVVAHELFHVFPLDYPILFWLNRLLPGCRLLFDWGGNIGLSYFAFQKHLKYPSGMTWLVSDVPAVIAEGETTARQYPSAGLEFTTSLERLGDADILLAAGALHFIEAPFDRLRAQQKLPASILLNKVPVYSRPAAVTLQNMGTALVPYHLFNEAEFVANFTGLGYRVVDEWENDLSCHIPFFPDHSVRAYKGYFFSR